MKLGFALITEQPIFNRIIEIEKSIHARAGFFDYLGEKINLPHTTIFQGNVSDDLDFCNVAEKVAEKFVELLPLKRIELENIVYVPEGWYFWMWKKTDALMNLHRATLKEVEPFILLDPDRLKRNTGIMSKSEIEGLKKYGYRYASDAYSPHITIGRSTGKNEHILDELNGLFSELPHISTIERLTVYKMGSNGTHAETLYEKEL